MAKSESKQRPLLGKAVFPEKEEIRSIHELKCCDWPGNSPLEMKADNKSNSIKITADSEAIYIIEDCKNLVMISKCLEAYLLEHRFICYKRMGMGYKSKVYGVLILCEARLFLQILQIEVY